MGRADAPGEFGGAYRKDLVPGDANALGGNMVGIEEADVERPALQVGRLFDGGDRHFDCWNGCPQGWKTRCKPEVRECGQGGDVNMSWIGVLTEILDGFTEPVECLDEARQGACADGSEVHSVALEERSPEVALELLDLSRHGARRYPQLLRGEGESPKPGRGLEGPEAVEGGESREWWCNCQRSLRFSKPTIPEICFAGKARFAESGAIWIGGPT
jgi:hypothetical protein